MNIKVLRRISQTLMVGLTAFIGLRHQVFGGGPEGSAPLDSYCPFGGAETAFQYFKTGEFITKTNYSDFVLLGAILALTVLAGFAFCSWICPFGAILEFLSFVGKKIFRKQIILPKTADKYLRYMRYVVLSIILIFTYRGATLVFEAYDPFKAIFHFNFETNTAILVFVTTIIISMVVDKAWCKYFCPLGGLMSIFGKFHLLKVRRHNEICIGCDFCSKECPSNVKITDYEKITDSKCTKCLDCMSVCPAKGALELQFGGDGNASK